MSWKTKKSSVPGFNIEDENSFLVVGEPTLESFRRERLGSDDGEKTIVESMFPPALDSPPILDEEEFDFVPPMCPEGEATPTETTPRPRKFGAPDFQKQPELHRTGKLSRSKPALQRPLSTGITEDDYRRIIRGQVVLGDLRSPDSEETNEESTDSEDCPQRKETIIKRPQPVNAASEIMARAKKAAIEEILQSVPTVYKSNLRILSNTGKMVRMETDELTFKLMMRDLQQSYEQHQFYGAPGTILSKTASLPNRNQVRKISAGQKIPKGVGRSASQLVKQPERKLDPEKLKLVRRGSDRKISVDPSKQPWVEIKLRHDDYSSLMSAIKNEPKSNHLIQKQIVNLAFLRLKLTYHTFSTKSLTSAPTKGRGEIVDYNVPLHEDLQQDVSFPIIILDLPISFSKLGEHIQNLERLYRMSLDFTFDKKQNASSNLDQYIVKFVDDTSDEFCKISADLSKSTPPTPTFTRNGLPNEGGSASGKFSGHYKVQSLDSAGKKMSPRKRDKPKQTIEKLVNQANFSVKKMSGSQM